MFPQLSKIANNTSEDLTVTYSGTTLVGSSLQYYPGRDPTLIKAGTTFSFGFISQSPVLYLGFNNHSFCTYFQDGDTVFITGSNGNYQVSGSASFTVDTANNTCIAKLSSEPPISEKSNMYSNLSIIIILLVLLFLINPGSKKITKDKFL